MADLIDRETVKAFVAVWQATPALSEELAGGIHQPPVPSPRPAYLYALVKSEFSNRRPREFSSDKSFVDYRDVTAELYGIDEKSLSAAARLVYGTYLGATLELDGFMRLEPVADKVEQPKDRAEGEDIWKATLQWTAWTHRNRP